MKTEGKEREERAKIESVPPSFISISKRLATLETLLSLSLSIYLPPSFPFQPPPLPGGEAAAAVLRFSTFSRFIPAASSLNRFPGEIYGRAIIHWSVGGRRKGGRRGERTVRERIIPGTFEAFFLLFST